MSDPEGRVWVTYNGEIYNDRPLRAELERDFGFRFRTHCDTEIIPAGYLAWGDTLFDRLEGMFAIAIWDAKERRLVLARDAIGIKPLFYSVDRSTVRFGSEIKSLLADPDQSCDLDPEVVHRFLALGHVGPTECMVRGIRQVPPGTIVSFCAGDVRADTFWRPGRKPVLRNLDEAVDAFMPIWDRVIGDQLVSDVEVGVLQSGGIDSSLVSQSVARHGQFPLFTASFDNPSYDETGVAAQVAQWTGLPHKPISINADTAPGATLATVIHHFDGQVADESAAPLLLLTRSLKKHSTVALSGDGGDEFFGGYLTYRVRVDCRAMGAISSRGTCSCRGSPDLCDGSAERNAIAGPDAVVAIFLRHRRRLALLARGMAPLLAGVLDARCLRIRLASVDGPIPFGGLSRGH